jgi:hypothetical protein
MTYTTPAIASSIDLAARLGLDAQFSAKRGGDDIKVD